MTFNDCEQFVDLFKELSNLNEIILEHTQSSYDDSTWETVAEIIEGHPNLEKVQLLAFKIRENSFDQFKEKFQNDWNIKLSSIKNVNNVSIEEKI